MIIIFKNIKKKLQNKMYKNNIKYYKNLSKFKK